MSGYTRLSPRRIANSFSRDLALPPSFAYYASLSLFLPPPFSSSSLASPSNSFHQRRTRYLRCLLRRRGVTYVRNVAVRTYERRTHRHPSLRWPPNDVERIGKVDRLKSIMPGDHRDESALVTVRSLVRERRPRYPYFLGRSLIRVVGGTT